MTMGGIYLGLHWVVAILPAVPFVMLYLAYRRTLVGKRFTVLQVMVREGVFERYLHVFGTDVSANKPPKPEDVVTTLFNLYYHWASYAFGISLNVLITIIVSACILTRAGLPLGLAPGLEQLAHRTLATVGFGFAGAYIWNLYDLVRRYRAVDMTPAAFQFSWLRLLAACIVGPLASLAVADGIKNVVAFGFGLLPLQTMFQYFKEYVMKRLGTGASEIPAANPTLHNLQGMTESLIERMAEEGIDSTSALAYADPMKLLLTTDIEWVFIIDIIDQALLFNYIMEKLPLVRPVGIRGSIELAVIYERLEKGDKKDVAAATELIKLLSAKLGATVPEVRNLAQTVWEDGQVELLWQLFGDSFPEEECDDAEEE